MNEDVEDKRRTNKLLRAVLRYLIAQSGELTPEHIHALCELTWWGKNPEANEKNKIRLLGQLTDQNFKGMRIDDVAKIVASTLGDSSVKSLVRGRTGFTRFYPVYRNSSAAWIRKNSTRISSLIRRAYELKNDKEGEELVIEIEGLRIPGAGRARNRSINAAFLLTPLLFALDPRLRFPIMNGADEIQRFFKQRGVKSLGAAEQYKALISLYGDGRVKDAAHLDFLLRDDAVLSRNLLSDALRRSVAGGVDRALTAKDERDVEVLRAATKGKRRNLHNRLTNTLRDILFDRFEVFEGGGENKFDVVVGNFDKKNDLLIEVKSSTDMSEVRMAIGQLYSYWFKRGGANKRGLIAVLLPARPEGEVISLLRWLDIGLLWIDDKKRLKTNTSWLKDMCSI